MSADRATGAQRVVSLSDKWEISAGRARMSGTEALVRVLLAQAELDKARGLRTAGYISGYRGSPLGNVDTILWSNSKRLTQAGIHFQPGLNEDMAATAVRGTQQIDAVPDALYEGVYAAWYGKGPGVDRSGDALKHGNFTGSHPKGGVLIFYGDDHGGKSSTIAHQSDQAIAANHIPILYPANTQEVLEYGLMGIAMSRYSGSWVGMKCVAEVAGQSATVEINLPEFQAIEPPPADPETWVHIQEGRFDPMHDDRMVAEHRLPRVQAFVRANGIDQVRFRAKRPRLGLVTAGKSDGDVRAALELLGLDGDAAAEAGISLLKIGCIWPLEPAGITAFAEGHDILLVIEEKRGFLEPQVAATLINLARHPRVIGKADEDGAELISATLQLESIDIARAIAGRLERLGILSDSVRNARDALGRGAIDAAPAMLKRSPYFCSGCPHNRSTRIPEGSLSLTGIGCHTMVNFVRPDEALLPTHMGGEGGNWVGLAPFTGTGHIFQNMGDGTYYHSGLLAIRAAVAAGVNITYKILYNDAAAMTGGQPVEGPISVARIAGQVRDEGVERVVLLSDDPDLHRRNPDIPRSVGIRHRDDLDQVQRELRETPGCTVLIYEQTCAAEKRRRRKRGTFPTAPKRLLISEAVCEGCGDCSVQSTCVSLVPIETEFGRKRAIDQSSCNQDYSCLNGFCPSFISVYGAELHKSEGVDLDEPLFDDLPVPPRITLGDKSFNLMIAGIGGTGVVTVSALIGMAAHIEGRAVSLFEMTGLSQKNGAVYSHVRIASSNSAIHTQRLARGGADLLLALDLVAALSPESAATIDPARTSIIANMAVSPTVAFQFDRSFTTDPAALLAGLRRTVGEDQLSAADASALALAILGDTIGANLFMVGLAAGRGLLPVGVEALEAAIKLNGVAVAMNLRAFRLGRCFAADPDRIVAIAEAAQPRQAPPPARRDELIASRVRHLTEYQDAKLAARYRMLVQRVSDLEAQVCPGSEALAAAAARNYAKLLAYKDEYEVARLLTSPEVREQIARTFTGGHRIAFNLAPPFLNRRKTDGRPKKREFGSWILPVLRLLSRLRGLRGTAFDPFSYSSERRMERSLVTEYEALVETTLEQLTPRNHARAVELLELAGEIRGFGPVKQASVEAYRARSRGLEESYRMGSTRQNKGAAAERPDLAEPAQIHEPADL